MAQFKKGDKVRRTGGNYHGMAKGDTATVTEVDGSHLHLDSYKDGGGWHDDTKFELVSTAELPDDDDDDDTPDDKPLTTQGKFSKGDEVMYVDGTTIPNDVFTVARCTASCVWFDETYSTPFNPDEFYIEDDD